jgi:6-phosphogluconolactonase
VLSLRFDVQPTVKVEQLTNLTALAERGATLFADAMRVAVDERGQFTVALAGGNTPRDMYRRLTQPPYGAALPWTQTQVFFGDERMVPPDSPKSNYRMAKETLLDHVPIPLDHVHRIRGELPPDEAVRLYVDELRSVFGAAGVPRFDLILLGMGPDGHTASLFPGTPALDNTTDLVTAVHLAPTAAGAAHAAWRVTLTLPVINAARHVVFLVAGADKAEPLRRVLAGDPTLPASRVRPSNGTLTWLVVEA